MSMRSAGTFTETASLKRLDGDAAPFGFDSSSQRLIQCRALIRRRRIVGDSLGFHLCQAPAMDILLDLYLAAFEGRVTYVWQSCVAANIPVSSAHRKVTDLIAKGYIERAGAMSDKRLASIQLSARGRAALDKLMDRLVQA